MCKRPVILLYCVALFFNENVFAQQEVDYSFQHISQSDGLLHTVVNSIIQDSKGYIWILTPNGLQRYDGSRFVNYPYDTNNPDILKNARDANLYADKQNNCLWITNGEIEKLDLSTNKFISYPPKKIMNDPGFNFDGFKGAGDSLTFAGDFGIYQFNKQGDKLLSYYSTASFLSPGKSNIYIVDNEKQESWMSNWFGLSLFSKKTKRIYTHNFNPIQHPLLQLMDKKELRELLIDSRENYWISTGGPTFYRYNALSKKITAYSLSDIAIETKNKPNRTGGLLIVNCFFEDNHHNIWIGTSNAGLLQYHADKDSFSRTFNEENNKQGLHYNYDIMCIFQDREDNIWLGTDKGINIFSPYHQYFQSIHHKENEPASLPKNEIMNFIQAANGDIIAGTWGGGITVYDSKFNFKKNISFPNPYEYNLVWSFVQNDDGKIWIGCQHGYIHIYDPLNGSIQTIHPAALNNCTIWCMAKDGKGNIWMGLHDGKIAGWDKQQNKFYAYNDSTGGITQTYSHPSNIFFDSKQRCWVATLTGFKQFDTEKRIFSASYTMDKNNGNSISSNNCEGIEELNDSTLLIGTLYGGLNFFNPEKRTFTQLTTSNGLPANSIHAIKKDDNGFIWFTTDYDLYKFKPAAKNFIRLNIEPGVVNSSFTKAAFYPLLDGRWLAATTTEIISFLPLDLSSMKKPDSRVEITGFKIFDSSLVIESLLAMNKPLQLSYKQNFLTVEFALLNFSNLQQTNYYYKLDDVDRDWVNGGTKRFANYTNLQPGEYVFNVKAENGYSNGVVTSFKIQIAPPFWKTKWFSILLLCLIVAIILALIKWKINAIRRDEKSKMLFNKQMAEMEMNVLRAQMNPHFIFNCINSIDALIQSNDKYHATVYLNKFAKLIRNILESSKQNTVTLSRDLDTLKLYIELEQLRHENKFTSTIHASENLLQDDYKVPPLIIQPFVENAILHGIRYRNDNNGKISVSIEKVSGFLKYIITDNGVGRNPVNPVVQKEKTSYGINMSTNRVKLFNNEEKPSVEIIDLMENGKPSGTTVIVFLKIQ